MQVETMLSDQIARFLDLATAEAKLTAANMANIDTPGYQTRDLDFRAELARANMGEDSSGEAAGLSYAANTPVARPVRGLLVRPDGNNVSVERESLLLAETQMKFSLGIQLLKDEFKTISQAINSGGGTSS